MPNDEVAGTIDYLASVMGEPVISAYERDELQRMYSSLVANWQGHRRNSRWTNFGEKARQGNVNGLSLLEFVARQLDERDHNALGKRKLNPEAKPESEAELHSSPMAERLRRQYKDEFANMANLPALQVDALWNEILHYARMGFDDLRRSPQNAALRAYQLPEIEEAATSDFLILPFVTSASRHPISLSKSDRQYLEDGRNMAANSKTFTTHAVDLMEKAASVMEQIAKANGMDVSGRIANKNFLVEKLKGGNLIDYFSRFGRDTLYRNAAEGDARRVFYEIGHITRRAAQYGVHLETLITGHEIVYLKRQAVNNPKLGLRGELQGIAQAVASGQTWRRIDLSTTDEFVPFSDDKALVAAYSRIKSAIETLADAAYRTPRPIAISVPLETSVAAEPAAIQAGTNIPFIPETPHKEIYPRISMNDTDARAILSMFKSGDLEGIAGYRLHGYHQETLANCVESVTSQINRHRREKNYAWFAGAAVAAGIAGLMIFSSMYIEKIMSQLKSKTIELICSGTPQTPYSQDRVPYSDRSGPKIVCEQKDKAKIGSLPRVVEYTPELPKSPLVLAYNVIEGGNLTHAVKRILGVRGGDEKVERAAYLTALDLARFNSLPDPNLVQPGLLKFPSNLRDRYNGHLASK